MTENAKNQLSPYLQFLAFIAITFVIIGIGYLIGAGIVMLLFGTKTLSAIAELNLGGPNVANGLWILQVVSTTIPIMVAAVLFAQFIVKDPEAYLKNNFKFAWVLPVIIFCVMLISSPLIEFLSSINQKLQLPSFLDGLQQWMLRTEAQAEKVTAILLQMKTIPSFIFKLLLVGLFTSIVEEFMFRGCIQTIFTKWTNNAHAAVWITAALFSAFHMEFFGFLPRMMLGVLFGYFVLWSGSIWTAVWGHFINNGTAVIVSYLFQNKMIKVNPEEQHIFNWAAYLFSLIIVLFLLYLYHTVATGKKQSPQL
jgi:membrane protease YdiL (CAAX protease family)